MKILMIAPQPFFAPRGTPISILGRLNALTLLGHEVDLVTYHLGQDLSLPGLTIHRAPRVPFVHAIKIGPSFVKLLLDCVLLIKAFCLLVKGRYDLIHAHEEAGFFGVVLARLFHLPHLYDMHSSLPQQLANFQYTRFRPLIHLFEWFERRTILGSDVVITICPALESHVRAISEGSPGVMIENVYGNGYPESANAEMVAAFRTRHALDGRKIVFYAGSFEPYQGIGLLIESAAAVTRRLENVLFLLMGGSEEQNRRYEAQVERLGLGKYFRFLGNRPLEEVVRGTQAADLLISLRAYGMNTPLKIYDYLRSGKPIVATNIHSHMQVLNPSAAVLVEPDPEAVARGILSVLEDPEFAGKLAAGARQLFESKYPFQAFIRKTEQALNFALEGNVRCAESAD